MARYSEAVDGLHDLLRWCTSVNGKAVVQSRGEYVSATSMSAMDVATAVNLFGGILENAEPIYWEQRLCDVIDAAALSLPTDWRLTDPMLFTQNGYIWFARPLARLPNHGKSTCGIVENVRAIAWRRRPKSLFVDVAFFVVPDLDARMRVFNFDTLGRAASYILDADMRKRIERAFRAIEQDDPRGKELVTKMALECFDRLGITRLGGIPWTLTPWRVGQTMKQTYDAMLDEVPLSEEDDQALRERLCDVCTFHYLRIFSACLNFLNTKVFISHREPTDRSVMNRVLPKPEWRETNVITLRKAESTKHPSDVDHGEVDWSCHWLVGAKDSGFWRYQYYPGTKSHQYRWIAAYMKGDFNKPFKPPSQRVYKVTR